jgi:putative acetyltransferase
MEIRRYRLGEEGAVWSVYFAATHESVARDYHPDLIERWAPRDQDMSEWADRLAQKNPFVAIVDEQIVGMAEIEADGFIDYFYVHPRWQCRGIGKALLAALECEAAKARVRVIFADVSVTAKPFFSSAGFIVTEAKSNVVLGHPAPNFRMQKRLSSEPSGAANRSQPFTQQTGQASAPAGSGR